MFDDATLWKLLDGELPAAEAEAIEAAAARDDGLRRRLDGLRAVKEGVLKDAPRPPAGFAARLVARALAPAPVLDLEDARRFLRRALVAAGILGGLGLAYLLTDVVPALFRVPEIWANPLR